ncbi:cilia- and flagella-associated protein 91 [Odontesthes bonariensis]|uniref:cilia- and flagella-associated protein 91 n=1 Tax=Odontesthes bonariensis TaxID=219752 RepID=UPI003F581EF2
MERPRVYDYLYDPVYTVSSEVDHARANLKACALKDRLRRVPEFGSIFSDRPSYTVKRDPADPVPTFTDHHWRGHVEQRKEALQQLAGVIPNTQTWLKRKKCDVTGADYWKYFKCPLIPFAQHFPSDVIFALPREDVVATGGKDAEQAPIHRTVGVQTDYRESETQTDPYSPEYVIQPGTTPSELLQLAALTWGHGLPAGLAEVEMIQRARAKRSWEASLPPLDDLSQIDKRRRRMEEMEAKEWAFRDGEIQKLQEARLAVLMDLLRQRDEAQKHLTIERLNQIYSKYQKDKETKLRKINNDYIRSLRKLEAKRKYVEGKLERRDIVTDSQTYTRQTHRDVFTNSNAHEMKSAYLDTYEGLLELEARLTTASVLKPRMKRPKPELMKYGIKSPASRAVALLKKYKAHQEEMTEKELHFLVKNEKPDPLPVTPRVEKPPEGDEETVLAVIHLQKLLRGRSIQYERFKGKENQRDLIHELRTVSALQSEEQQLLMADKKRIITLKKQRNQQRLTNAQEEASYAAVEGAELERMFDTLSKELIHLQEERRIHAFLLVAERERRRREAEESGRRPVEERRRREEDEVFRQVVQVHQESVVMYLEDIILGTLEQAADQQAREEIHRKAKEFNDIVYAVEESRDTLQSEEIVSELVYSFLIPEVEKINVRQRVHQKQHRHLQGTQSIIQGTTAPTGTPSSGSSQSACPGVKTSSQILEELIGQVEQGKQEGHQHTYTE